ncbi:GGDEF domain-containing protein [Colwellia sp. E2M01]|nr:GGDEF domain-containing protein [Colwellia sp. E2M01]
MSIFLCLNSLLISAQEGNEQVLFDRVAEQVTQLKKSNIAEALTQLTSFEKKLNLLSIEQNLKYFKLLSEVQIEQNQYTAAKDTANKGLTIARKLSSPSLFITELLYLKGFAFESLGDLNQATKEYKKGLEVAESLHNKVNIAAGLINLGTISYLKEDFKRALILLNDAYNIASQTDNDALKGRANSVLGILYSHLQQDEQSMGYYQQSYLHFKKAGMLLAAHNSLNNMATTHISNNNYLNAINVLKTIIAESNNETANDRMFVVYLNMAWAHLKQEQSNPEEAYKYLLKAKGYLLLSEKKGNHLQFFIDEAYILFALERFDEALISINNVNAILDKLNEMSKLNTKNYLNMIDLKGSIYHKQGKFKKAFDTQSQLIKLTNKEYENEDNSSITQVRLKLEAEQADKENKLLYNQQLLYEESLKEASLNNEKQRVYLLFGALVALAFAWVLVRLIQSQKRLTIVSNIDALTGVANRRSLMNKSQEAFEAAKIKNHQLSLLMIDADHFKKVNDTLGHSVGDQVLAKIAFISSKIMRKSDIFGRYGGEEFLICLPNTNFKSAMNIAERIRVSIYEHAWQISDLNKVSVSIGVVSLTDEKNLITLVKKADEQLYQAKSLGRNKVCGE